MASEAEKGKPYICPICNQAMLFRKGDRKRPHFAHKVLSPNCTAETALHYGFKTLLYQRIQAHLEQQQPLEIQWHCSECDELHKGNLLKKATRAEVEYNLGDTRPDIALLNAQETVVAVIEVVVSHAPEAKALEYYAATNIPVVLYQLHSDADITRLNRVILELDQLELCTHPKCSRCKVPMGRKWLHIWHDSECSKCRTPMKAAFMYGQKGYVDFPSAEEAKIANQLGCNLQYRSKKGYFGNVCKKCGAFNWINRGAELEEIETGYYCPTCDY